MSTTDLFSQILYNDGEGLTADDLNGSQRFLGASLFDQVLEKLAGAVSLSSIIEPTFGGQNGADAPSLWAYALTPGGAYLRAGSGNDKIQIAPGTLLQKIANADGEAPTLVPFAFAGTEEWTISAGGTNPRVDLLQMKLEYVEGGSETRDFEDSATRAKSTTTPNKRRRVQATLSVKSGTAAASPTIPDPDAGCVPVGMALVGSTWTSATAPTFGADLGAGTNALSVHDLRMPLVVRAFRVDPTAFKLETAWALASSNQYALSSSGTNKMYVGAQVGPGRLIGIGIELGGAASLSVTPQLGLMVNAFGSAPSSAFTQGHVLSGGGTMLNAPMLRYYRRDFEAHHTLGAGPVVQESATNKIGVPIWSNGYRVANDDPSGDSCGHVGVGFVNMSNGQQIGGVTFYVAVGL